MISIRLAPYRSVWLWVGELPAPCFTPDATVEHSLPATVSLVPPNCAAAELLIIYGPRAEYGMLGASFAPEASAKLAIQIATSIADQSARLIWQHSKASSQVTYPFGYSGLPAEYSDSVLHGVLDGPERDQLGGGILTFGCAAHHPIDSSRQAFRRLAKIVVRLLQPDAQTLSHAELTEMVREKVQG